MFLHIILSIQPDLYAFAYYNYQAIPLHNKIFVKLKPYKIGISPM